MSNQLARLATSPEWLQYLVKASARTQGGANQLVFKFPNGYGASVIRGGISYGATDGMFELAALGSDGSITYDTHITDDVLGWLSGEDVLENLSAIRDLPPAPAPEITAAKLLEGS